jgi:hypothetical protein
VFQKKIVEEIKTHFAFSNVFRKSCVLWDNVEKFCRFGRPQMTIWRVCILCRVPKAKNTHSEYVILMLLRCKSGCSKAPQYYVIHTLSILYILYRVQCWTQYRITFIINSDSSQKHVSGKAWNLPLVLIEFWKFIIS